MGGVVMLRLNSLRGRKNDSPGGECRHGIQVDIISASFCWRVQSCTSFVLNYIRFVIYGVLLKCFVEQTWDPLRLQRIWMFSPQDHSNIVKSITQFANCPMSLYRIKGVQQQKWLGKQSNFLGIETCHIVSQRERHAVVPRCTRYRVP
jgi:hypothetical protein